MHVIEREERRKKKEEETVLKKPLCCDPDLNPQTQAPECYPLGHCALPKLLNFGSIETSSWY